MWAWRKHVIYIFALQILCYRGIFNCQEILRSIKETESLWNSFGERNIQWFISSLPLEECIYLKISLRSRSGRMSSWVNRINVMVMQSKQLACVLSTCSSPLHISQRLTYTAGSKDRVVQYPEVTWTRCLIGCTWLMLVLFYRHFSPNISPPPIFTFSLLLHYQLYVVTSEY